MNKPNEAGPASVVTTIRLKAHLRRRLDQAVEEASSAIAPGSVSRNAMISLLIERGLDALDQQATPSADEIAPPSSANAELLGELLLAVRQNAEASRRIADAIERADLLPRGVADEVWLDSLPDRAES